MVRPIQVKAATNTRASAWGVLMMGRPDGNPDGAPPTPGLAVGSQGRERGQSGWTRSPGFQWLALRLTA
jgi:hypothetical protein